jgi:hypothetical protein
MEDFLQKEGVTGGLHKMVPPGNKTDVWGDPLWRYLNQVGLAMVLDAALRVQAYPLRLRSCRFAFVLLFLCFALAFTLRRTSLSLLWRCSRSALHCFCTASYFFSATFALLSLCFALLCAASALLYTAFALLRTPLSLLLRCFSSSLHCFCAASALLLCCF